MIIRQASLSDVQALSGLAMATYSDAFGHTFSPADLVAHLARTLAPQNFERILLEDTVLVAETGPHLVGFVQFGSADPTAASPTQDQELRRLYVHATWQNKGVGTLLMDAAFAHPRLKDAARVFLDVWEHNHGAQRLYARYGFQVIGERAFLVESGAETSLDWIMVRHRSGPTHLPSSGEPYPAPTEET